MNSIISIIIPVYNVEQYLDKCIQSIVQQTYKNLEIILVDDGSPDNCPKMCDVWEKKDNRITVIHKENGGLSDARNKGLDIAKGEYFYFCDSDDYISEETIESLYEKSIATEADITVGNYAIVTNDYEFPQHFPRITVDKDNAFEMLLQYSQMSIAWNKLYRRDLWNDFRFPYGKVHEDDFTGYLLIDKCSKIACIEDVTYYYFQNEESITKSKFKIQNLDGIEARILMVKFFISKEKYELACRSLYITIPFFAKGYIYLDLAQEKNKNKMYVLLNEYKTLYKKLKKHLCHLNKGHRIFMWSLYVHPTLLNIIWKLNLKRSKNNGKVK